MTIDLDDMLEKVVTGRWSMDAIDWHAPGAERIRPEQYEDLRAFMCDLVWIEHVGARGFAALARKANDPRLRAIYASFVEEEEQHAQAELALMRRWGMVEPGEIPEPNINVRLAVAWLDRHADSVDFTTLTSVIAMLEVALDGALVKFLLDEVDDPLCADVFAHINRDEARHLAVDFHVMELNGMREQTRETVRLIAGTLSPRRLMGLLVYIPLLSRMRDNLVKMGLDEERLYRAIHRFDAIGSRSPHTAKSSAYRAIRAHGRMVVNRDHPYHYLGDAMVALTALVPPSLLGPLPGWARALAQSEAA